MTETDTVEVTLSFLPSAHRLLCMIASVLRRPVRKLLAGLICLDAQILADELTTALLNEGIESNEMLLELAGEWMKFEAITSHGNMPVGRDGLNHWSLFEFDPWETEPALTPTCKRTAAEIRQSANGRCLA